jgi:nicotinamide-nucleotide amidase
MKGRAAMTGLTAMAEELGAMLKQRGETVAIAESSTGGLVSAALLAVPGASAYFRGGAVVYTREAKRALAGVSDPDLAAARPATEDHALHLARAVRARLGTDWAVGETGATGPTGNRYGDAPGHSCIALAGPVERTITVETGDADRETNMWAFTEAALGLLREALMPRS